MIQSYTIPFVLMNFSIIDTEHASNWDTVGTPLFGSAVMKRTLNEECVYEMVLTLNRDCSYKALKVGTCKKGRSMTKEAQVLDYLKSRDSVHDGRSWVRNACDIFQIDVPGGSHTCLVYEPLGISLSERIDLQPTKRLELPIVKLVTYCLLLGIDYLHTSGVIHTGKYSLHWWRVRFTNGRYLNLDIKLDNIQEALPDDGTEILTRLVDAEKKEPGPQKIVNDRVTIYTSRSMDYKEEVVYPILADMGMAVFGETEYSHIIQPIPYRAPEVILGMKWKESVDIWNFGVLVSIYTHLTDRNWWYQVWELLCGEHLFGKDNEHDTLAKMIRYLGSPPVEFLKRSDVHLQYFDEQGQRPLSPLRLPIRKSRTNIDQGAGEGFLWSRPQ